MEEEKMNVVSVEKQRPACAYCDLIIPLTNHKKIKIKEGRKIKKIFLCDDGGESCFEKWIKVKAAKKEIINIHNLLNGYDTGICIAELQKTTRLSVVRNIAYNLIQKIKLSITVLKEKTKNILRQLQTRIGKLIRLLDLPEKPLSTS